MNHSEHEENHIFSIAVTVIGAVLTVLSFFFSGTAENILLISACLLCTLPIIRDAFEALREKEIEESVLLIIAVTAALITGEYFEAAAVTVLFGFGELLEDFARDRSRRSIEEIYGIISDTANRIESDGTLLKIDSDEIKAGMKLAVLPHEIIPADGIIIDGGGDVDTSPLTGESLPVQVQAGAKLLSGYINGNNTLYYEATEDKNNSSAARIAEAVEKAAQDKGKSQSIISEFAKYYTPSVIAAALLIAVIPSVITGNFETWIHRSLILLVASCPCAIVLSAPLAFFSSMGACAKNGMIVKGSRYIEALAKADTAVFDKTGTLTENELETGKIHCKDGFDSDYILSLAAKCEFGSSHPIAKAITASAGDVDTSDVTDITEIPSGGASVNAACGKILCGGKRFMNDECIDISGFPDAPVYVALNGNAVGAIEIESRVRSNAASVISALKNLGIKKTVMLTGDSAEQAKRISNLCGTDKYYSSLLPDGKANALRKIKEDAKSVIYVGDGINDAPVLALADAGAAMGLGTRAAGEAADLILTNSDLSKLPDAILQSKRTMSVLKTNIIFAIAVKIAVIALGIIGIAPMWWAVLADVGTMIICVINSSRLLKVKHISYE